MRKSRPLKTIIFLGLLVAIAGGALFAFWPQIFSLIEDELIYREKAKRWKLASSGQTLPGTPDLQNLSSRLAERNMSLGVPVFVRIFKREFELEVWLKRDGRFERFATYPVCMWSGALGPKLQQGDRQSPEGFYTVDKSSLNPNSKYHRSFNLGFPNAYDRAHGRTGSFLMVHGDCRSVGCYAMTDAVIDEIWTLVTSALNAGQKGFQVQVFPFRMTDANLARHAHAPETPFWRQLKAGHDAFEAGHVPPDVGVCGDSYVFRPGSGEKDGSAPIAARCSAESRGSG
ncbi:MAG TPA: murein L,D-transpeptidase family protein [Hyphomicrobium sp.]|jgi:murein L,D-transpeptidase YafK